VTVATSVIGVAARAGGRLDYRELWRHSVVTAAVAKHLAELAGYPEPEEIFTAGLLHDLGKFLLEIHAPDSYWRVIRNCRRNGMDLCAAEQATFGFDHAVLGEAFGISWNFPAVFRTCCGHHHDGPLEPDGDPLVARARALVALGDYLANTMEPPDCDLGFDPSRIDVGDLHRAAGLTRAKIEADLPAIREAVERAEVYLDLDPYNT
jgi:putative nucleotidyltransferase with HDIG domain